MKRSHLLFLGFVLIGSNCFAQWKLQNSGTTNNLNSVCFTDANTGIAVGDNGTILKSTNAGDQWLSQISNTRNRLNSACFTDANTGYTAGDSGTMLKTTDGGINWEPQISGTTSNILSVDFPVTDTGYAAGENGTFLKTTVGGMTWISMNFDSVNTIKAVFFIDADTGYIIGERWIGGWILNVAFIQKTVNGGTDWIDCYSFSSSTDYVTFSSIYFVNSEIGYVSGAVTGYFGYPKQIKTINGGADWFDCSTGPGTSMYFTDSETGYSAGGGTIQKTTDAGTSWQTQFSDGLKQLRSIFFPTTDTGFTVGSGGVILRTLNGGGNPVEIHENPQTASLNIYPNPAKDKITISSPSLTGITQLSIFNVNGEKVIEKQLTNTETQIDISALPRGVYFVRLQNEKMVEVGKMVKE